MGYIFRLGWVAIHLTWCAILPVTEALAAAGPDASGEADVARVQRVEQAHLSTFEAWCSGELANENRSRAELAALQRRFTPADGDAALLDTLERQAEDLAARLERRRSEASEEQARRARTSADVADLQKQVAALSSALDEQSSGEGASRALGDLLEQARVAMRRAEAQVADIAGPDDLKLEVAKLESELLAKTSMVAGLRAQQRASSEGGKLVQAAVAEEESAASELQSLCGLARRAKERRQKDLWPKVRGVARQLAEATKSPAAVAPPPPPLPAVASLA
mmetsp:Transcript_158706/g.505239  ORF Transcript_158706/g.505239 Transcript_158706/m.505239 type:complete len:280 (+) Transcript_158706:112-951(+)